MSPGRPLADGDQLRGHPETLLETGWQGSDLTFEQAGGSPGPHDSPFAAQTVQCSPTFSCSYTLVTAQGPAPRACPWEEEACIVRNLKQHSLTADTPTPSGGDPCADPRPSIQKSHPKLPLGITLVQPLVFILSGETDAAATLVAACSSQA